MEYIQYLLDAHPLAQAAILASIIGPIVALLIAGSNKSDGKQGGMGKGQQQGGNRNPPKPRR